MKTWIESYIKQQNATLEAIQPAQIEQLVEVLKVAYVNDRQVFVVGNGGSAANASHFATDLGKGASDKLKKRFKVLSLTDNVSWITAIGNDYAYDQIFVRQLMNFAKPGDVLLGLSVSGNSPNLLKAYEWALANGMETIALVGGKKGKLADMAHHTIVVPSEHYGRAEDVQMNICHMLCYAFMEIPGTVE